MKTRTFGRTGWHVSEVSFGAWAVGGSWGDVDDDQSLAAMRRALELGVNFFDTADVYGDGHSERLIQRLRKETKTPFYVATKAGRRLNPHIASAYNAANLTAFVERSLTNLGVDTLDLVQLHCPPTEAYYQPETFAAMDALVKAGKIKHYGVSVEKVEEALKAMEFPNVASVQIIFNMFRQRPAEHFLREAKRRNVATIIRVPLASGMLTGKLTAAIRSSPPTTTATSTATASSSTSAKHSPASTTTPACAPSKNSNASSPRRHPRPNRTPLDSHVRRRLHRHPRRKNRRPSREQRRRQRLAARSQKTKCKKSSTFTIAT